MSTPVRFTKGGIPVRIVGGGGIAPLDGVVIVKHGATAGTARPTAGIVYWLGSVAPTNKQLGDFWLETGAYD